MAQKTNWLAWTLGVGGVALVLCIGLSVVAVKAAPTLSLQYISSALPDLKVTSRAWTLEFPSKAWRRMTDGGAARMPVKKDAWFVRPSGNAYLAIEEVKAGEDLQFLPALMATAMVGVHRRASTEFEVVHSETFETCGVPAELRELRATKNGQKVGIVMGSFSALGRGYDVSAWSTMDSFESLAGELRTAVKSFCPLDGDYEREWLRNFILSTEEPLKSALESDDRDQRSLDLHWQGRMYLSRRDLNRLAELMLLLAKDVAPEDCKALWNWSSSLLEQQLRKRTVNELRDWFRIERHAQLAAFTQTPPDDMADDAAMDAAIEQAYARPDLAAAFRRYHLPDLDENDAAYCQSVRSIYEYGVALPVEEREAFLRSLVWAD